MGDRIFAVDLNNDGVPDLVTTNLNGNCEFTVSLGNGQGGFLPPLPNTQIDTGLLADDYCPMATGDFNGDGKADLFFAVVGSNEILTFLGNGDGTFQYPLISHVTMPAGAGFILYIAAADFNHDGATDVVVEYETAYSSTVGYQRTILLLEGNNQGGFASHNMVSFAPNIVGQGFAVGDFDADGNADFAYMSVCGSASCTAQHVLYGDGKLGFTDTTPITAAGAISNAGDLNSDGRTDLFGINADTNQLVVLYGQRDRTFDAYFSSAPTGGSIGNPFIGGAEPYLQIADINGDGRMDIVGEFNHAFSGKTQKLVSFLGTRSLGQFTVHSIFLPAHQYTTNPVVADFNRDQRPDIVVNHGDNSSALESILTTAINTTDAGSWSSCDYPLQGRGMALCAPITYAGSPANFSLTATDFRPLRKIELWVDGKKIAQQDHTWEGNAWFNYSTSFAAGTHRGTFFAADIGNNLQRLDFNFNVGQGPCTMPTSEGVRICKPLSGSTVSSPVLVEAAANIAGTLDRMELWVDGVKKYTEKTTLSFYTQVYLGAGNHSFAVYAVNTSGTKWLQTTYAVTGP